MDSARAYDLGVLYFFGSLNRNWLDPVVRVVTALGDPWALAGVVLALVVLFAWRRRWRFAAVIAGVACAAAGLQLGVARFVDRPRPDVSWRSVDQPASPGFPSGHATGAAAVYIGGALLASRQFASCRRADALLVAGVVVALLVGLSRPYLGVSYPVDVLAGWVGGSICALAGSAWAGQVRPRGTVED